MRDLRSEIRKSRGESAWALRSRISGLASPISYFALALGFRQAAKAIQEVRLDPVEVVLGLRVDHAEDGVGVAAAMDMGDAPIIALDGDARRLPLADASLDVVVSFETIEHFADLRLVDHQGRA